MTQGFGATDDYGQEKMIDSRSYRSAGVTRCGTVKPVRILVVPYTCFDPEKRPKTDRKLGESGHL